MRVTGTLSPTVIDMCFSGTCPHEKWDGECCKKPADPCPAAFKAEEDYWNAVEFPVCDDPLDFGE